MSNTLDLQIRGIPNAVPAHEKAIFRTRLNTAIAPLTPYIDAQKTIISMGTADAVQSVERVLKQRDQADAQDAQNHERFQARTPDHTFEQLILPEAVMKNLTAAIDLWDVESLVFDTWGLRAIEPYPNVALNFYGKPGTGKTLAAHALAHRLGKNIIVMSYAEIESKYHGDGPKNVQAVFEEAEAQNAVLFMDEADSLLSRRLTDVTSGSEQAINSMRSQLLICLEKFKGIVVFATNLVHNYDKAFETRVRHIEFPMPTADARTAIWEKHLPPTLPRASDINTQALGEDIDDICGRDIRNAVLDAAVRAAIAKQESIQQQNLVEAIERIKDARIEEHTQGGRPLDDEEKKALQKRIKGQLSATARTDAAE